MKEGLKNNKNENVILFISEKNSRGSISSQTDRRKKRKRIRKFFVVGLSVICWVSALSREWKRRKICYLSI